MKNSIGGDGPVDEDPNTMNYTRVARGGTIGPLYYTYLLSKKFIIRNVADHIHIENQSAIKIHNPPPKGAGLLQHLTND